MRRQRYSLLPSLMRRTVLQDMDAILGGEPVIRSPASVDYSATIIERLEQQVEAMYIGMEPRKRTSMPTAASCMTESVRDHSRGQIIRVVTTTPMSCSMEESARLFWHHLTLQRDVPDKSYRFVSVSACYWSEKRLSELTLATLFPVVAAANQRRSDREELRHADARHGEQLPDQRPPVYAQVH